MGRPNEHTAIQPDWVNQQGDIVHPDAPAGSGGMGGFYLAQSGSRDAGRTQLPLPHPRSQAGRRVDPIRVQHTAAKAKKQKAASQQALPVVTRDLSANINGVSVLVRADAGHVAGITGAKTQIEYRVGDFKNIRYKQTPGQEVVSFVMPAVSVTIQTQYGTGKPSDTSAYGRGTTADDIQQGDVSLAFHESCHRRDYLKYLHDNHPPTFDGKVGMKLEDFTKAVTKWNEAWQEYVTSLSASSVQGTDEVGSPTRSDYCRDHPGQCGG